MKITGRRQCEAVCVTKELLEGQPTPFGHQSDQANNGTGRWNERSSNRTSARASKP